MTSRSAFTPVARSSFAVLGAALLLLAGAALRSSPASACGCCGGSSRNAPIGWSESGNSLLVERSWSFRCELGTALEVWRRGQVEPAACFDRHRDPDHRVACDAISMHGGTQAIRPSGRTALYPREARVLRSDHVRVTALPRRGVGNGWTRAATVEVRAASEWRSVWSGDVHFPSYSDDGEGAAQFDIWPSPTSSAALLRIQDVDPTRTGHDSPYHDVRMLWITLPDGVSAHTLSQRDPRRPDTLHDVRRSPILLPEVGEVLW